jgi:hypothetical protein
MSKNEKKHIIYQLEQKRKELTHVLSKPFEVGRMREK